MLDSASKKTYYRVTTRSIRGSSNGRTADSESAYLGSNPSPRANTKTAISAVFVLNSMRHLPQVPHQTHA